jgi:hypothetical protein
LEVKPPETRFVVARLEMSVVIWLSRKARYSRGVRTDCKDALRVYRNLIADP